MHPIDAVVVLDVTEDGPDCIGSILGEADVPEGGKYFTALYVPAEKRLDLCAETLSQTSYWALRS